MNTFDKKPNQDTVIIQCVSARVHYSSVNTFTKRDNNSVWPENKPIISLRFVSIRKLLESLKQRILPAISNQHFEKKEVKMYELQTVKFSI